MLNAVLRKIKKIIYPVNYIVENFDNIPTDLLWPTNDILNARFHVTNTLLTEIRNLQLLSKNEVFQGHLNALKAGEEEEFPAVSYALASTVRRFFVHHDRERSGRRTAICTVALGDSYRKVVDYCLQSQQRYADRADADYVMLQLKPAHTHHHPAWFKVALVFKCLKEGYDRVLFIDADAMVTNYDISLDQLFAPLEGRREVLLLAEDEAGLNTGVMLAKKSPATYRLLDLIWTHNLGHHVTNWEQQALIDLMNSYPVVKDYVLIAPDAKAFNSFPYEREHYFRLIQQNNWTPGDFICHFSGIRSPLLEQIISYYVKEYDLGAGLELHDADQPKK